MVRQKRHGTVGVDVEWTCKKDDQDACGTFFYCDIEDGSQEGTCEIIVWPIVLIVLAVVGLVVGVCVCVFCCPCCAAVAVGMGIGSCCC